MSILLKMPWRKRSKLSLLWVFNTPFNYFHVYKYNTPHCCQFQSKETEIQEGGIHYSTSPPLGTPLIS